MDEALFGPFVFPATRELRSQEPISDEIFEVYREQCTYDPTPPNAVVESREEG